jgi:hypothetical protein
MSAGVITKTLLLALIITAMSVSGCAYANNRIMAHKIDKILYGDMFKSYK